MFCVNREASPESLTRVLLSKLRTATKAYIEDCHQQPSVENDVFYRQITGDNSKKMEYMEFTKRNINANREIIDSWQTPIKITINQDRNIIFTSAGKDKKIGTKDDINSDSLLINSN